MMGKHLEASVMRMEDDQLKPLIWSVYTIETTYRPWYFRLIEYMVMVLMFLRLKLLKKPMKNYTVTKSQIGMLAILKHAGYPIEDFRKDFIQAISFGELLTIFKYIRDKNSLALTKWYIEDLLDNRHFHDPLSRARYIGLAYNGRYGYAMRVEALVKAFT